MARSAIDVAMHHVAEVHDADDTLAVRVEIIAAANQHVVVVEVVVQRASA